MAKFKGLSTIDRVRAPYSLIDSDLIKRDLMNEFYTKRGERVMRPNFGSIIWDTLMDPGTPELEEEILEDVKKIIGHEPRAELLDTRILLLGNTLRIDIDLRFIPFDNVDTLYLSYARDITEGIN